MKIVVMQRIVWIGIIALMLFACEKKEGDPNDLYGHIALKFEHRLNGKPLVYDQMIYENKAGNEYLVNEIQYFISDVTLQDAEGNKFILDAWKDIFYIDTDLPETHLHEFPDELTPGKYTLHSFTFGISAEKNQSLMFVNPPESLMFWPELLGGGYHYMKLNGKWLDTLGQISPFNFHLGIGQVYVSYPDVIDHYVQNYFDVTLSCPDFEIKAEQTTQLTIVMNVENWFQSPNIYNHDDWGGDIMQNQEAMHLACENGWDVFSCELK
jgi:hypothetical protein